MNDEQLYSPPEDIPMEDPPMYVILVRLSYKSAIPDEREIIEPAADPYAPDAPRRTFDHLARADIQRLIMRNCIALSPKSVNHPDKEQ